MLKFTTGSSYARVVISWANEITSDTADGYVRILMNGETVYNSKTKEGSDANESSPKNLHLIIPSNTDFELKVGNGGDPKNWKTTLEGEVYA